MSKFLWLVNNLKNRMLLIWRLAIIFMGTKEETSFLFRAVVIFKLTWFCLQFNMYSFCATFYSKRYCIVENIHQQNVKLLGVTFFIRVSIYKRNFTLSYCPYKWGYSILFDEIKVLKVRNKHDRQAVMKNSFSKNWLLWKIS